VTQLKEWAFDGKKENGCGGVNAELNADESWGGGERHVVARAKFLDEADDDFLN
jgi:hypothetical protein